MRDDIHFDLGFPRGARPFLVTLRADLRSPFVPGLHPLERPTPKPASSEAPSGQEEASAPKEASSPEKSVVIDLEGIADRIIAFPVPVGRYGQIAGIPGKALFTVFPIEGMLSQRAIRKPDLWYHDGDHAILLRSNLVCHDVHFDPIQRIMRPI